MESFTRKVKVTNPHGLHARPSLVIVKTVKKYDAKVAIGRGNHSIDAANMLDLLSLGAAQGAELVLTASGPQAEAVLDALVHLFDVEFEVEYED
jgi:phosphotransferase system HPr (HPr) family protein